MTSSNRPLIAYVAPFAIFLVLTELEQHPPFLDHYPIFYLVKIAIVLGAWLYFRREYPAFSTKGLPLGVTVGVVGVIVWIALSKLALERFLEPYLPSALLGKRVGYNPFEAIDNLGMRSLFLSARFFGLVVVVPLIEEVFWRGFLLRYLIDENFTAVPFTRFTALSFWLTTLGFALVHPEKLAAIAWAAGVTGLLYRTGNLWATIVAHAVTNLLLGLFVIGAGAWTLW